MIVHTHFSSVFVPSGVYLNKHFDNLFDQLGEEQEVLQALSPSIIFAHGLDALYISSRSACVRLRQFSQRLTKMPTCWKKIKVFLPAWTSSLSAIIRNEPHVRNRNVKSCSLHGARALCGSGFVCKMSDRIDSCANTQVSLPQRSNQAHSLAPVLLGFH